MYGNGARCKKVLKFKEACPVQGDCPDKHRYLEMAVELPDNICLCHGLAGNYLIIKWYLQKYSDKGLEERGEVLLRLLICQLEDDARAAAQERNRVGLMCGLAGAGMALWLSTNISLIDRAAICTLASVCGWIP